MATKQYDVPLGGSDSAVVRTVGGAITGSVVRISADDTATKSEVLRAIEAIKIALTETNWP